MIVRRRVWTYLTVDMRQARRIEFPTPVTKRQVEQTIIRQYKKIPLKVWPT